VTNFAIFIACFEFPTHLITGTCAATYCSNGHLFTKDTTPMPKC